MNKSVAQVSIRRYIYRPMNTPCFPAFRCRLAALGRHTLRTVRQTTLAQLQQHLSDLLPAPLLCAEEDGPNSRQRIFTLRLTCECFLWQMLKPETSCREVVRQVQARQRLPKERLEKALSATAQAAERRAGSGGQLHHRPVKVVDGSTTQLPD